MQIIVGTVDRRTPVVIDTLDLASGEFTSVTLDAEYRLDPPVGYPGDFTAPGLGQGTVYPNETVNLPACEAAALVDIGAASYP